MKLLFLDIETSPNLALVWGLFKQNVAINQIVDSSYTMCWAAKWHGDEDIYFDSLNQSSKRDMLERIHALLEEADAVVTYNGARFDIPTLNKEFVLQGFHPPTPYKQVDLFKVVRSTFRFPSMKLDYVLQALDIGKKVDHKGMELWVECMNGDPEAWEKMEEYNKGDVAPLEKLYERLQPWITAHPNHALYKDTDRPVCTNCGSSRVISKGTEKTKTQEYRRFKCNDCGTPLRSRFTILDKEKKEHVLVQAKG